MRLPGAGKSGSFSGQPMPEYLVEDAAVPVIVDFHSIIEAEQNLESALSGHWSG